jgi:hypothetical protein
VRRVAYYIYYRVSAGHDARAFQAVRQAQTEVAAATGTRARLLEKRDEPDLWMEVYEGIADADAFERELTAAVGRHGLTGLLQAGASRKTEIFVEAPCA